MSHVQMTRLDDATHYRPSTSTMFGKNPSERAVIALDFDCFYASVALRDRPELQDKPVAIVQKHICVTVNYVARSPEHGGVKKMSTVNEALKQCPNIIMIDGSDLAPFRRANREIVQVTRQFFPTGRKVPIGKNGLDELFVDVTNIVDDQQYPWTFQGFVYGKSGEENDNIDDTMIRRRLMIASHLANELRQHIFRTTKLTCCAGISTSKLISKVAVNMHKPNQQSTILPNMVLEIISDLSPRELMGLGHSTLTALQAWARKEFTKVGQLAQTFPLHDRAKSLRFLRQALSSSSSSFGGYVTDEKLFRLVEMFHGIDTTNVVDLNDEAGHGQDDQDEQIRDAPKSISVEDACRNCRDMKSVRSIVKTLSTRLLNLMIEDAKAYGGDGCMRRARTMSVGYRHFGDGYKSTWRSSSAPVEVTGTNLAVAVNGVPHVNSSKVRDAIECRVVKVLKDSAGVGIGRPFQLTLIGVGVSNFSHTFVNQSGKDTHGFLANTKSVTRVGKVKTRNIASFFSAGSSGNSSKKRLNELRVDGVGIKKKKT